MHRRNGAHHEHRHLSRRDRDRLRPRWYRGVAGPGRRGLSYRRYPGQVKLAQLLSARFTVYSYDRRGRGDSGDSARYAVSREIEDLAAMIGAAGGNAHVWGLSSGAVLALEAADGGVPIRKLAIQEPPLVVDPADRQPPGNLHQHLSELIDAGSRSEAVPT